MKASTRHLLLWGVAVSAGYLYTYWAAQQAEFSKTTVSLVWLVLMLVPVADALYTRYASHTDEGASWSMSKAWVAPVVVGMLLVFASLAIDSHTFQHFTFRTLWFLVGAIAFTYIAYKTGGTRRVLYAFWAVTNLAVFIWLITDYDAIKTKVFLIGLAIQGLPMLIDIPLHRRAIS